jgi:hypothetical protein
MVRVVSKVLREKRAQLVKLGCQELLVHKDKEEILAQVD